MSRRGSQRDRSLWLFVRSAESNEDEFAEARENLRNGVWDANDIDHQGQTPLFVAATLGKVKVVDILLRHGANVNTTDQDGRTALFIAAKNGNVEVVKVLLSHGGNVNATNHYGRTALFYAAKNGVVEVLLSHGGNVNATDQDGKTALFVAATNGNVEVVKVLLSHGGNVNATVQNGRTALFYAAESGNVEVVEVLLSHGGNVNATDQDGGTALFFAAKNGNVEVVEVLLSHGGNVNATDQDGGTALFDAAENGNVEVVEVLLSHGGNVNATDQYGRTALFYAAIKYGNVEIVKVLLSHGGNVNATDQYGRTALFDAATIYVNVEVVKILLSHGGNVNATDQYGRTALLIAAIKYGNVEIVKVLLSHGWNVNATDQYGRTALFLAAKNGNVEIVKVLLSHGGNVNATDQYGRTALFYAAIKYGNVEVVEVLLSHGGNVNATDQYGRTALFLAAEKGNVEVVKALLGHEVNVNATDQYGRTALFYAGSVEVVEAVLNGGGDVNVADQQGKTALISAVKKGNVLIVDALVSHGMNVNASGQYGHTAMFYAANAEVSKNLLGHGGNATNVQSETTLFSAAKQGDVAVVEDLASHGANVNATDQYGQTALFYAGNAEVVKSLLHHDGIVDATDQQDKTALFVAVAEDNVEVVEALLIHGANVNATDEFGRTALFFADSVEVVDALASRGTSVNATDQYGQTALFYAGNAEVVERLSHHGGIVDAVDQQDKTALFVAVAEDNVEVAEALLIHGANVNATDEFGQTALFFADSVEIAEAVLSHNGHVNAIDHQGKTALFVAAAENNVEVTEALLAHNGDVNATDQEEKTALFSAAERGNVEVVEALLTHDVIVDKCDKSGRTALFAAVTSGKSEVVDCLLKSGASASVVDKSGNSPIFYTANLMSRDVPNDAVKKIIELLMKKEESPYPKNCAGENLLLHFLSFAREIKGKMNEWSLQSLFRTCQFLIDCKSDVDSRDSNGHSVIHLALLLLRDILLQESKGLMLKHLITERTLEFICSIFSRCLESLAGLRDNTDGNTPLHLWAMSEQLMSPLQQPTEQGSSDGVFEIDSAACPIDNLNEIAKELLSHGAKVNIANNIGETPLHLAQTWNAAKFLLNKGALPDARDHQGNTPLLSRVKRLADQHSTSVPHLPLYEMYDKMNAETLKKHWEEIFCYHLDPWKANNEGRTLLGSLLQTDAHHLIQALLEVTKAPSTQTYLLDDTGDTPLHTICRDIGKAHFWKLNLISDLVTSERSLVNCSNRKGKSALHIVCQSEDSNSLACEVVKLLCNNGARVDAPDGEGKTCLVIAADKPQLMALLTQDTNTFGVKPWLPWSSKSERHKNLLAEVARGQNSRQMDSLHYNVQTPIGKGAFGFVFAGLNSSNGQEVAVKQIMRAQMNRPEDHREIRNLVRLSDCECVVRYLSYHTDQDFLYIVLELMEGTLTELMDEKLQLKQEEVLLCRDVVNGLMFLHQRGVKHRDIKAANILYKCIPKLRLKLADFGLSSRVAGSSEDTATVMHNQAGTKCWMAPELLKGTGETAQHSESSDMFACGLVLHYLLSSKKHPFGPQDETGKSDHVIKHETEDNILNDRLTVDVELNHEARDLVRQLLNSNKEKRPSAGEASRHPFFWSNLKKVGFLQTVGNQPEIGRPWHSKRWSGPPTSFDLDLENAFKSQLSTKGWDTEIPRVYAEMTSRRKYATNSAVDLLRMFRNAHSHLPELTQITKESILDKMVFFDKFPNLVIEVYKAVISSGWDKRKEIAAVLDDA